MAGGAGVLTGEDCAVVSLEDVLDRGLGAVFVHFDLRGLAGALLLTLRGLDVVQAEALPTSICTQKDGAHPAG